MFLLKFHVDGKAYLLHDGKQFIGTEKKGDIGPVRIENLAKSLSVGGFETIETSKYNLEQMIGGVPYPITSFNGGLIPVKGVQIVNENWVE